jgi:group II intron reverse transcriptase/maturase
MSETDNRLTMTPRIKPSCAGAKTQMGQEHAYKGLGSGWSPRAQAQVYIVHREMSWSLANVSCRRTPGPLVQTTRKGTDQVFRTMLKRRIKTHQQQETLSSIRMKHNGNACKQPFSMRNHEKLSGIYDKCHTTINMKPVNFMGHWRRMEDRGSVVPNARHYGKGAKSTHDSDVNLDQGVACSDQRLNATVSSNDEQVQPDSTWTILNKLNRMGGINSHPINGLHKQMRRLDLWITAYAKLSRNPGSLTRGTDSNTIDGTSIETLKALQAKVLTGSYPWGSIRRIWIPKPGRSEKRPLGIPNFQDRVVQEVIRMLLDAIYEPRFKDCSHGFRANRGQQSSIKYVRGWFPGTTWYIEGVSKCYDSIDHDVLLALLKRRIKDKQFIGLIESGLKSKVIDCKVIFTTELGTPQGGVVSPLLSNIYLHEMDRYLYRVMRVINRGERRRTNLEYHRLTNVAYRARKKQDFTAAANALKRARQLPSKDPMDDQYRRVRFVRYADDFLIGVIGSKALAVRLKESVKNFLNARLKLKLSEEKTHITHHDQRIPWLGFLITAKKPQVSKARLSNRTILQRIPPLGVKVYADMKQIINRLAEKGYCDRAGFSIPNWKEALQPPQTYSVDRGARVIRGLDSYYKVANDRRATTHRVMYIIRNSLAKTFAAKFKLDTMSKVMAKARKDLSKPLQSKKPVIGNTDERQIKDAEKAGGKLIDRTIRIPFTLAKEVAKPDLSHSFRDGG